MVEFGLKLEDNKVAEWSEFYIRYEHLKQILKRCSAAQKRFTELSSRHPERSARVIKDWNSGVQTPLQSSQNLITSSRSLTELHDLSWHGSTIHSTTDRDVSLRTEDATIEIVTPSEQTALSPPPGANIPLPTGTGDANTMGVDTAGDTKKPTGIESLATASEYGTTGSTHLTESPSRKSSTSAISRAISGVSDYFHRSYERQVRDCLKVRSACTKEFQTSLQQDIHRVNSFYEEKLQELEERLSVLRESVAQAHGQTTQNTASQQPIATAPPLGEEDLLPDDEYLQAPLIETNQHSVNRQMGNLATAIRRRLSSTPVQTNRHRHQRTDSSNISPVLTLGEDEDEDDDGTRQRATDDRDARKIKEAQSIQRALVDQYRTAKLLHNYAIMNYTGFVKIVKKHDKTLSSEKGKFKKDVTPENICNEGKRVQVMEGYMEQLYANWFCGRNLSEARAQMLPKRGDGLEMDWSQLRLGYRMGMSSILALWVCWDCIWGLVRDGNTTIGSRTAFPVFRGGFGLLLVEWYWGCSVWVWSRYRVNYIYIMDLDPSVVRSALSLFNEAVDDTLIFLINMLLYYKAGAHDIPGNFPPGLFPAFTVLYMVYRLIFPLKARVPMWLAIWRVISAPLESPTFFQSYVGDIFTSMVKVFQDLAWTVFFMLSGDFLVPEDGPVAGRSSWSKTTWYSKLLIPLITLLPLWFRFNQCLRRYMDTRKRFPHLANAFKYALSQTVTLFGAFHPLYMNNREESDIFQLFWSFVFVASSLYSFAWDVYMDWGLGLPKYWFLGPRLMYPKRSVYYATIAADLVLRFAWVLTLLPPDSGAAFALPAYLTAVSMMLELSRRTVWGFLRLENEHRSNTSGYRRVGFVPLHFSTGHTHEYKHEKEHRGFSVLIEVGVVTILVVGAAVVSVVAAQHATQRSKGEL